MSTSTSSEEHWEYSQRAGQAVRVPALPLSALEGRSRAQAQEDEEDDVYYTAESIENEMVEKLG